MDKPKFSMTKKTSERISPGSASDAGAIAHRAYEIWQRAGCPDGRAMEHWLQAEVEMAADGANVAAVSGNGNSRPSRRSISKSSEKRFQMTGQ